MWNCPRVEVNVHVTEYSVMRHFIIKDEEEEDCRSPLCCQGVNPIVGFD